MDVTEWPNMAWWQIAGSILISLVFTGVVYAGIPILICYYLQKKNKKFKSRPIVIVNAICVCLIISIIRYSTSGEIGNLVPAVLWACVTLAFCNHKFGSEFVPKISHKRKDIANNSKPTAGASPNSKNKPQSKDAPVNADSQKITDEPESSGKPKNNKKANGGKKK